MEFQWTLFHRLIAIAEYTRRVYCFLRLDRADTFMVIMGQCQPLREAQLIQICQGHRLWMKPWNPLWKNPGYPDASMLMLHCNKTSGFPSGPGDNACFLVLPLIYNPLA